VRLSEKYITLTDSTLCSNPCVESDIDLSMPTIYMVLKPDSLLLALNNDKPYFYVSKIPIQVFKYFGNTLHT